MQCQCPLTAESSTPSGLVPSRDRRDRAAYFEKRLVMFARPPPRDCTSMADRSPDATRSRTGGESQNEAVLLPIFRVVERERCTWKRWNEAGTAGESSAETSSHDVARADQRRKLKQEPPKHERDVLLRSLSDTLHLVTRFDVEEVRSALAGLDARSRENSSGVLRTLLRNCGESRRGWRRARGLVVT